MGLSEPALVTPREKILDPRTGKPAGGSDPFFSQVNSELADKGFLVAAADAADQTRAGRHRGLMARRG